MVLNNINTPLRTLGCLLEGNGQLLAHCRDDCDHKFLSIIEFLLDGRPKITLRDFNIVFGCPVLSQEVEIIVVNENLRKAMRTW
jgi:hypothetical protein